LYKVIAPCIAQGSWLVSDRFTDATYAYQGGGRGVDMTRIAALEQFVQGDFRPDATLLFDAPVHVALARVAGRGEPDRFEKEQAAFFAKVRETYLQRAHAEPQRFHLIDAAVAMADVQDAVRAVLDRLLETWR
jgi:dTMP kinase